MQNISSEKFVEKDLANLKSIFLSNGYSGRLLDKLFDYNNNNKKKFMGPEKCPVYLKLSWLGSISENYFERLSKTPQKRHFSQQNSVVSIFSTRTILPSTPKDSLPAFSSSCVVYDVKYECGSRNVGGRTQRLNERIKQHVPSVIRNKTVPLRQQPKRRCTSAQTINYDSAIGRHLLSNRCCANNYSDSKFIILAKCSSTFLLKIMESMYIKFNGSDLCRQEEFVFNLALF